MIAQACPACGRRLKVKDELAGKRVKCSQCGQPVPVPVMAFATAGAPDAAASQATLPPPARSADQDTKSGLGGSPAGFANPQSPDSGQEVLTSFLAPPQQPDELGRLGPHRVLKVLGAGGMGVVFKAEEPQLKRLVAVKAMLPALASSPVARQRFLREAQAAAAVKHDCVVTIYQVGEDRGIPFLAMEFLEGESLEERLRRDGRLPIPDLLAVGRKVAEGLAAAHQRGLIHRDVKPANVWLESVEEGRRLREQNGDKIAPDSPLTLAPSSSPRVKILDFGLARAAADTDRLTQSGAIVGTPAYMAPEQTRGQGVDHRADLFSLGAVLYQMATGELPFKGVDTISTLAAVAFDDPRPPCEINPEVPPALSELVLRLLAKDPGQRYQRATEVIRDLLIINCPPAAAAPPPAGPPTADSRSRPPVPGKSNRTRPARPAPAMEKGPAQTRPPRRWPFLAGGGALGLAAVAAALILIRIATDNGELVIETDDPQVEVVVKQAGREVTIVDLQTRQQLQLRSGEYELALRGDPIGLRLSTDTFVLKRGDRKIVSIRKGGTAAAGAAPEFVVDASGGGQYASLGEAILKAKAGSVIRVRPGTYREDTVTIRADLTIVGDGPAGGVIVETGKAAKTGTCGFHLLADRATVRNLTVRSHRGRAFWAERGTQIVEDCTLTALNEGGGSEPTVLVTGRETSCTLRRCKVRGTVNSCGVVAYEGQTVLEGCEVFENATQGFEVASWARVRLSKCRLHDNKINGILVTGKASGTLEGCELVSNGESGAFATGGGTLHLHDCRAMENGLHGVRAAEKGTVTVRGGKVDENKFCGVAVEKESEASLEGCDLFGNGSQGVGLSQGSRGLLHRCRLHDNKHHGICVQSHTESCKAVDCDIFNNAMSGVYLAEGDALVVRNCRIHRNSHYGVTVENEGGGIVEGCDLAGNLEGPWRIGPDCQVERKDNRENG